MVKRIFGGKYLIINSFTLIGKYVNDILILLFICLVVCQDANILCKTEPAFLLDILCQIETVSQQCPKRCNKCSEVGKYHEYLNILSIPMHYSYLFVYKFV